MEKSKDKLDTAREKIVIDNGSSKHTVYNETFFRDALQVRRIVVELVIRTRVTSKLKDFVDIEAGGGRLGIEHLYHIPDMRLKVLSYSKIDERGVTTKIERGICAIKNCRNKGWKGESEEERKTAYLSSQCLATLQQEQ